MGTEERVIDQPRFTSELVHSPYEVDECLWAMGLIGGAVALL